MSNDNQIDQILVDAVHGCHVIDVRSLRRPDGDTDHILVKAKVRARISCKKINTTVPKIKWNSAKYQKKRAKTYKPHGKPSIRQSQKQLIIY